jgi:hypothetical protein
LGAFFLGGRGVGSGLGSGVGASVVGWVVGWGRVDKDRVKQGVGARDYGDRQDFQSSVFIRRTKPRIPLDSIDLLKVAARGFVEALDRSDRTVKLKNSRVLSTAWLDGERAVRVQAVYASKTYSGRTFVEETWFVQHGSYLYWVTFQHGTSDDVDERHAQIDPMVVSFRWKH